MIEISCDEILRSERYGLQIVLYGIFGITGMLVSIYPLVSAKTINAGTLLLEAFMLAAFGVPFGYFLGVRNILNEIRTVRQIKKGQYKVLEDELIDLYMLGQGMDSGDSYCQFTFRNYSNVTGKNVVVSRREFNEAKKGDRYYLVFLDKQKSPIRYYPQKKYTYQAKGKS